MFLVGLFVLLTSGPAGASYASTPISARYAQVLLSASVLVHPLTAFYITVSVALEGAGSTTRPMLAVVAGLFILRIPLADRLALHFKKGMTGIVTPIIVSHFAVALSAVSQMKSFFGGDKQSANVKKTSQAHFLSAESANSAKVGTFSMRTATVPEQCKQ
ncbi:MAG: hypothetical protein IT342_11080 [Candidatus Melainabacteria bacterium]|nr:hypothetical protein [Candidatus Melainabacteria bacterium]